MSKSRKTEDTDAVERIAVFNTKWDSRLLPRKFDAMAHDASSFLRATAHLFFDRLVQITLPPSPLVFGCGDLHLENFGSYSGENRLTYFDQNDFDEAALMPAGVEMVRFLASIIVTIRLHEPDDLDPKRQAKQALDAYAAALAGGKPGWIERELARGPVADLLSGLAGRSHRDQLDLFSRVGRHGRRKLLRDGRRSFPLPKESEPLEAQIKATLAAIGKERGERGFWKLRDLAGRIAGKGSLGRPRYVALVKGHGDPDGNFLIDIKSAWPPAALAAVEAPQPVFADAAERVVFVQRLAQARSPAFLQTALLANQPFILRELQPAEDRLAIEALVERPKRLSLAIETLSRIAAWDQLRGCGRRGAAGAEELIAFGAEEHWRRELLEAAAECAAEVERDYASFEAAWRKRDSRLTALIGTR
ncbi:Uncharacterized conserved protein, DUF2252 family [Rhizobiales bacterium GAS188]|jgi:uncharacterized protein (DUF2252 family)|nr:Uncharacterized conserved protein, DUF2252 family [Rhizobiales bacterium GAS188]